MIKLEKLKRFAPLTVRLGVALVYLWFGINQLISPDDFIGYLPNMILSTDYAGLFVTMNGLFEIVFASFLLLGLYVRPVSFVLAFHLAGIAISLGYNDIAIRDWGLVLATFSVFMHGPDDFSLAKKIKSRFIF